VTPPVTSIADYYNSRQCCAYHTPSTVQHGDDGAVLLHTKGMVPQTRDVQPGSTVDSYYAESQGVWHPDSWAPEMVWQGIGAGNPFASLGRQLLVDGYTEAVRSIDGQGSRETFQLFMGCTAFKNVASERGSVGLARQGVIAVFVRITSRAVHC
jgi:hypothetical protein